MARAIRTLRDMMERLQEMPDHYLDTPLEVWIDGHLILCDNVGEITDNASPSFVFKGVGFKNQIVKIVYSDDELWEQTR